LKRLLQAPNLVIATLWADQLRDAGFPTQVMRAYASGIAGEIPPDQALPEVWLLDDAQLEAASAWHEQWVRPVDRRWACPGCAEIIDGPFEVCWNCGAQAPTP
jgi:hypothetical protein